MSQIDDQKYLLSDQYKDASNLDARAQLHVRFSTNPYGWMPWVFDQLTLLPASRILELGCGPGYLWRDNMQRIPEGWDITLTDLSPGMLEQAKKNLADSPRQFKFETADAQYLSFEDESFDAVIANHMLYHVPDRNKAFAEIRRVLRPRGRFYAATIGISHMAELNELVGRFDPDLLSLDGNTLWGGSAAESFLLENGADQISQWFPKVELRRYNDALVVTEAEPLVNYIVSGGSVGAALVREKRAQFTRFVEQELAEKGAIRITKDSGIFEAQKD